MKNIAVILIVLIAVNFVSSRWLPTRENSDRLDKLREMLQDILESEYEKSLYNKGAIFKREAMRPPLNSPISAIQHPESKVSAVTIAKKH